MSSRTELKSINPRNQMNPETIHDYLGRAEMTEAQSEALSHVFAEMATRSDLVRIEDRIQSMESKFEGRLRAEIADLRSDLVWKMIAIVGFFATASTVLNLFVA